MKRRNVNALAPCLLAVLMAATVAFVGLSADAASGKQEAAYEAMAVVNTQGAANLTTGKFAGIASIVNDQEAYTGNRSLKEDIDYQAVKAVTGISGDDVDKRLSEAETGAAKTQQEKEAAWEGRTIASNVEEYVYVRAEADENSDVVGKLVKGAAGDVLEKGDQWTRISSGEVEGYVSNDYLVSSAPLFRCPRKPFRRHFPSLRMTGRLPRFPFQRFRASPFFQVLPVSLLPNQALH